LDAETIRKLIEDGLPGARADVQGDDGVHFEATVVCDAFAGKMPLARHRMVYATLGDLMGGAIHALALKTVTPAEVAGRSPKYTVPTTIQPTNGRRYHTPRRLHGHDRIDRRQAAAR
jgi:acid stress-induced BolA-like protein IbaG/YrbA